MRVRYNECGCHGGEADRADELDGGHGAQRQPVDRDVEARVHGGEHATPRDHHSAGRAREVAPRSARLAPRGEDQRCRRDSQPGDAQNIDLCEEQDRERRPELVKDGADDEVRVRRNRTGVEVAANTPEVIECQRVTGEDCYVMKIVFRSIDDLEGLIDRFTPFGQTTTSIVNATPVPQRGIPIYDPNGSPRRL